MVFTIHVSVKAQVDSLISVISTLPNNSEKALLYKEISGYLLEASPDSAMFYAQEGLRLAKKIEDVIAIEKNLFAIASAFEFKNELDSSLRNFDLAIELAALRGDDRSANDMLVNKGNIYYYKGDYAAAVASYDQSLTYFEQNGELERQSRILNNLAIIYRLRKNYDKAIETYQRSINIKAQLNDTLGLANSYFNLGRAAYYNDDFELGISNLDLALSYFQSLNKEYDVATVKASMGECYLGLNNLTEAEIYLTEAFEVLKADLSMSLLLCVMSLSSIDRTNGKFNRALDRLLEYYPYVKDWDRLDSRKAFENELALVYAELKDFENAFIHLREFATLTEEVANENRERLAEEMQTRFETREKENLIKVQDLEITKNEREKQTLFLGVAIVFILLLGAVVFGISKSRNNERLRAEKIKTEAALKDRETLLREIHHRVKNNLQIVSSLLSIQGREITDEKAQQAVNESRNRVRSMALIHQFLYGEQHLSSIDMQQYIEQLGQNLFNTYKIDHDLVFLKTEIDEMHLDVDTAIPVGLILNELITNALKYAFPDGKEGLLIVRLRETNGALELLVKDNGVGVVGDIPKSSSFGMKLLNAFKQKLEADFTIVNENGLEVTYVIRKYNLA